MSQTMWSVYVSCNEPRYPRGMQRVGKRTGLLVSVRAADAAAALLRGAEVARKKGAKRVRGEWATLMEGV